MKRKSANTDLHVYNMTQPPRKKQVAAVTEKKKLGFVFETLLTSVARDGEDSTWIET